MVAIEVVHFMRTKTKGREGCVALKLDISKAYDRMSWEYLSAVLTRMGFNDKWVHWMAMCVESVDYSVLVNGEKVGPVIPGRGLRQGDPLSPYLFILCAEGLSSLIDRAEATGDNTGTSICRGAPRVTHLLFADDCFLFFKACERQTQNMKNILSLYEAASGQAISLPKSEVFYSRNVSGPLKHSITDILGVQVVLGTGKYLGLPSMIGRNRTAVFAYIKDRVWHKVNSWSNKRLSKAGREVMIKSVLQAIPSYVMSIFLLPDTIISAIEKMMNSFWWGSGGANNRGIHWMAWERLSVHKSYGGMGFKDLTAFNLAMLGKQGWKLQTDTDSLVARIFKARYFPHGTYLTASLGHNPSYVWRSILQARFIVRSSARWCIGTGASIPLLHEPWLSDGECIEGDYDLQQISGNLSVQSLINNTTKTWNQNIVQQVFSPAHASAILNTPLIEQVADDRLIWKEEKNGYYSVKSAYRHCVTVLTDSSHLRRDGHWQGIWRLKIPPKVKDLMWRMCRNVVPTRKRLQDKGVQCPLTCVSCSESEEDLDHICFHCPFSVQVWQRIGFWNVIQQTRANTGSVADCIFSLLQHYDNDNSQRFSAILWSLWKHRNLKLWEDVNETDSQVIDRAFHLIEDWSTANATIQSQAPLNIPTRGAQHTTYGMASSSTSTTSWQHPLQGRLKCNVDASFSESLNSTGVGMCIRDADGTFVLAKTFNFSPRCVVPLGEAMGLLFAIQWLRDLAIDHVDIALDSKIVTDAFHKQWPDVTEFGHVMSTARSLFSASFTNSRVEFNRRQANEVAHVLARVAHFSASPTIYIDVPHCIEQIIINEML
ncbi:putative mitochondrial protein [Trifolium repens]|nr:putative mitochondrial protein [Trifolium repens]